MLRQLAARQSMETGQRISQNRVIRDLIRNASDAEA